MLITINFRFRFTLCLFCLNFVFISLQGTPLRLGIDCLEENEFNDLKDCGKIGILTHTAATNSKNIPTCDIFVESNKKQLAGRVICFFSPEHGLMGKANGGESIQNEIYKNIVVRSLYENKEGVKTIDASVFEDIDTLIIDLVDIGVRCYTYITCMRYALEACLRLNKRVIILDRPNPLGRKVAGALLEKDLQNYVGGYKIPFLHGMTMGELATMLIKNYQPHPNLPKLIISDTTIKSLDTPSSPLRIIKMKNYKADALWINQEKQSGFVWHAPSPNIPCFESALGYSCTPAFSLYGNFISIQTKDKAKDSDMNVQPFVFFTLRNGCKYDLKRILAQLNNLKIPGVSFLASKNGSQEGIILHILNWEVFDPGFCTLQLLKIDQSIDKELGNMNKFQYLNQTFFKKTEHSIPFFNSGCQEYLSVARTIVGDKDFLNLLASGPLTDEHVESTNKKWKEENKHFIEQRKDWLLY